jgi:ribosomal protein L3 glutamine methyltransferase
MSAHSELFTVRDFLRYAATRFNQAGLYYGHGTDNAWDEAAALIIHSLHLPHDLLSMILDARLVEDERTRLLELIHQRVDKRIPLAYLTHEAWFSGMSFYVDERVLIPRSPIAEMIENGFRPWVNGEDVHHVLDLCTGSACIAIALAKAFPDAQVDATDISDDALTVAKINVLRHNVIDEVQCYKSDLFADLPAKKYDLIVSNPPYVSQQEMGELPEEYRHEPELGLEAGQEGLDIVKRILLEAVDYLSPNGVLVVEVGNSEHALAEAFPETPFTWVSFERGGDGVFLLTSAQLQEHHARQHRTSLC